MCVQWLGDETEADEDVLILALDRWTQRRMLREIKRFEEDVASEERTRRTPERVAACRRMRATAITLMAWLREAIPPAGFTEGSTTDEE